MASGNSTPNQLDLDRKKLAAAFSALEKYVNSKEYYKKKRSESYKYGYCKTIVNQVEASGLTSRVEDLLTLYVLKGPKISIINITSSDSDKKLIQSFIDKIGLCDYQQGRGKYQITLRKMSHAYPVQMITLLEKYNSGKGAKPSFDTSNFLGSGKTLPVYLVEFHVLKCMDPAIIDAVTANKICCVVYYANRLEISTWTSKTANLSRPAIKQDDPIYSVNEECIPLEVKKSALSKCTEILMLDGGKFTGTHLLNDLYDAVAANIPDYRKKKFEKDLGNLGFS